MSNYNKQIGSSTMGLLAATAIFTGLLVYATFYAFEKDPQVQAANPSKGDDTVQLQSQLPVDSIADGQSEKQIKPTESIKMAKSTAAEISVQEQAPVTQVPELKQPDSQKIQTVERTTEPSSVVQPTPLLHTVVDQQQAGFYDIGQLQAQAYQQYLQATSAYSRGVARAQNASQGRGEFNFTMKFASRARMDAQSAIDSRLRNNYYAGQYAYYQAQQQLAQQQAYQLNN